MAKPATVEEYIAAAPEDRRSGLEALRRTVVTTAPEAAELISYAIPSYKLDGRALVSFAAFTQHYSVFPASRFVLEALGDEAAPFAHGRGTFRFPADEPLPLELIGRIVAVRVKEVGRADG